MTEQNFKLKSKGKWLELGEKIKLSGLGKSQNVKVFRDEENRPFMVVKDSDTGEFHSLVEVANEDVAKALKVENLSEKTIEQACSEVWDEN